MKTKHLILTAIIFFIALTIISCGNGNNKTEEKPKTGNTESKTYTCPMHPEVKSDKPGKCPKCGMDLEEVKK